MTIAQISGFLLICVMMRIVFITTRYVSGAKFQGHGIYYLTINAWFRSNFVYKQWLRSNKIYHWCILLIIALCSTILLLIEPFRQNQMFVRPEASIFISLLLWVASERVHNWFFKS